MAVAEEAMAAQAPRHQIQMRSLNRSQRPILQAQTVAPALAWLVAAQVAASEEGHMVAWAAQMVVA